MITKLKIAWIHVKTFFLLLYRFFKARIGLVIYRLKAKSSGYKIITAKEMLTEFPPKSHCKKCNYGQGFKVIQHPSKEKNIVFCDCVLKQYSKSEKKYIVRGIE